MTITPVFSFPLQDAFVPTQSQDAAQQSQKDSASQRLDSAAFTLPLQLSADAASSAAQQNSQCVQEDSQATQIEELEEPPAADTSDSMTSRCDQNPESNGVPLESQGAAVPKAPASGRSGSDTDAELSSSQKSDAHKTSLNVQNVNVRDRGCDGRESGAADVVSCSQLKLDVSDGTDNSCVQETPLDTTVSTLASQSMNSQAEDVKGSAESQSTQPPSLNHAAGDVAGEPGGAEEEEEEEVMEEESTVRDGASGVALVLSQSKLSSPEPMDDSVIVVTESERDAQMVQKDVAPQSKTNSSQPIRGAESLSTNGHESPAPPKKVPVDSDRLSQTEGAGPEPEGLKDKSLSDSSGGKMDPNHKHGC